MKYFVYHPEWKEPDDAVLRQRYANLFADAIGYKTLARFFRDKRSSWLSVSQQVAGCELALAACELVSFSKAAKE